MTRIGSLSCLCVLTVACHRDAEAPPSPVGTTEDSVVDAAATSERANHTQSTHAEPSITSPPSADPTSAPPVAEPIPASLLKVLETTPYVEVNCKPEPSDTFPEAKRCAYTAMGVEAEVVVANPSAETTARWLMDAARSCAPLEALRTSHPDAWERGVRAFARHLRMQSSRIFPISGSIVEDLGDGPHAFGFDRGVVSPCVKGSCRCRVNSLTSSALCRYRASLGEDRDACNRAFDDEETWRRQCAGNHRRALDTGVNEHLHARAHLVGEAVKKKCDARLARPKGKPCEPFEVVLLVETELGFGPK